MEVRGGWSPGEGVDTSRLIWRLGRLKRLAGWILNCFSLDMADCSNWKAGILLGGSTDFVSTVPVLYFLVMGDARLETDSGLGGAGGGG